MSEQLSGRELDKAIALALGYTARWIDWKSAHHSGVDGMYALHDPQGKQAMEGHENENEAWFTPRSPGRTVYVPAFHADANAVIGVCAARGWDILIQTDVWRGDTAEWRVEIRHTHTMVSVGEAHGATPQEAAARALLAAITAEAVQL